MTYNKYTGGNAMKLYIKQKVFSIGESFEVRNEFNEIVYYVRGSFFRIPKKFEIYDTNQNEVATVESQLFRLMSHYSIKTPTDSLTLKEHFTFFKRKFELTGTSWLLQGDFMSHNYQVIQGQRPIMLLSKHWFTWGDSYELDIEDDKDALLCLCIVIAVDAVLAKSNAGAASSSS